MLIHIVQFLVTIELEPSDMTNQEKKNFQTEVAIEEAEGSYAEGNSEGKQS